MNTSAISEKIKYEKINNFFNKNYPEININNTLNIFPIFSIFCNPKNKAFFIYIGSSFNEYNFILINDMYNTFLHSIESKVFDFKSLGIACTKIKSSDIKKVDSNLYNVGIFQCYLSSFNLNKEEKYFMITNLLQWLDHSYPEELLKLY